MERQWHVDQHKIAVGFVKVTSSSSLLGVISLFFCHCFKIFEIFTV